jgi:hypothetical protein
MPITFSSRGMTWGHPFDPLSIRLSQVSQIILFLSFSHANFIHFRHNYMFVSSTNHVALDWSPSRNADCSYLLTRCTVLGFNDTIANRMFHSRSSHIHYGTYGAVNVLWDIAAEAFVNCPGRTVGCKTYDIATTCFINFVSVSQV